MSSPRTLLVLAAAALAAGGFLGVTDRGERAAQPAERTPSAATFPQGSGDVVAGEPRVDPGAGRSSSLDPGDAPRGVSVDQWRALAAELRGRPDAAAELARLRAYLEWSEAVQRWRAEPGNAALAAEVRAGLPERLARREVSAAEARLLEGTLLATLEPDEVRRAQALRDFDATLPAPAAPDARDRAYQQAQAAAVAAWRATPVAQRDPATLNAELQRLRRQHFAQNPTPAHKETPR